MIFYKGFKSKKKNLFFRGWGEGAARVSEFVFTKNTNRKKKKKTYFLERGWGEGGGAGVRDFFTRNPNLK